MRREVGMSLQSKILFDEKTVSALVIHPQKAHSGAEFNEITQAAIEYKKVNQDKIVLIEYPPDMLVCINKNATPQSLEKALSGAFFETIQKDTYRWIMVLGMAVIVVWFLIELM